MHRASQQHGQLRYTNTYSNPMAPIGQRYKWPQRFDDYLNVITHECKPGYFSEINIVTNCEVLLPCNG
jgi:hypothetical protein